MRDRLRRVGEQRLLEVRIGPGLGDDARAVVRADLGLVGLDDGVERGRIDVALLGQDRLERAHAQLRLGELRAVVVIMVVVVTMIVVVMMIVVLVGHGNPELKRLIVSKFAKADDPVSSAPAAKSRPPGHGSGPSMRIGRWPICRA